jgi:hypothetical protein
MVTGHVLTLEWLLPLEDQERWTDVSRRCSVCTHLKIRILNIQWNLGSLTLLFMNNSVHEQIFQQNVSDDKRRLGLRTRKLATAANWEYRRGSVSCWLTNLVSVYEHFGSRTASRNELSSWTEVPLYISRNWGCYTHLKIRNVEQTCHDAAVSASIWRSEWWTYI